MKFIPLTKKEPPFNERLIIWVEGGWIDAELAEKKETLEGKVYKFVHYRGKEQEFIDNATHFLLIEGPKEWPKE